MALSAVTDAYFCEIDVLPSHRRRGIGTRLYAAIHELTDRRFPVLARAMDSRPLRRAFCEALGCEVLVHCPAPWVDPPSAAARDWVAGQPVPDGFDTRTIADEPDARLLDAWATYFSWAHQRFGTVHPERIPETWSEYGSRLDRRASMITVDDTNRIVAFSFVTVDSWDGRTFVVCETVRHDQPDGVRLLGATVAASIADLADRTIGRVQLEGHTTDPHLPALVAGLPPAGSDPLDILRLAPPVRR